MSLPAIQDALSLFKLEKLKVHVYSDQERKSEVKTLTMMFNPESYSLDYQNVFDAKQGINTSGGDACYAMTKPSLLKLKLIIDGSGVNQFGLEQYQTPPKDVYYEVQDFLDATLIMNGATHKPGFLKLTWGDLIFKCRLETVNVTYTLFKNTGEPLRAELDCLFRGDLAPTERARKENKQSPDITHSLTVRAMDTLPLLCKKVYGAAHYYIKVAEANQLSSWRDIFPGQELIFPPLAK